MDLGQQIQSAKSLEGIEILKPRLSSTEFNLVSFTAVRNRRNKVFIASTNNYVDGMRVKQFLIHGGCSSILVPFANCEEFDTVSLKYGDPLLYDWKIAKRSELVIQQRHKRSVFQIRLCTDNLPRENPTVLMDELRFAICQEDANWLLATPRVLKLLSQADAVLVNKIAVSSLGRSKYGSLGQGFLNKFDSLQLSKVTLYFPVEAISLEGGWVKLSRMCAEVERFKDMPKNFEEYEDDDHVDPYDSDEE